MPIDKILILEDNEALAKEVTNFLRSNRHEVTHATLLSVARELIAKDTFDLLLLDLNLPDGSGLDLLRELRNRPQKPLVAMMTGDGSVKSVVECMQHGAFDYLTKPFALDELELTIQKADNVAKLLRVNRYLSHNPDADAEQALLGKSKAIENLRQLIRKVARTEATILIQGESGTGKELIAQEIYRQSSRADAPFIRVNCAAIPENLTESEFFGHEKGAFTGASNKREGRFELAHGGTILLDEISEVLPTVQAKLLRVLQERELERVGGTRTIKVDVRVIATTNRNLNESVARKEFREDLFFRLNVVPIHAPTLRDRRDDVPYLAAQFMQRFSRQHGVHLSGISQASLQTLLAHDWPGNVRELQNVIERAVILCSEGDMIEPHHLGMLNLGVAQGVRASSGQETPGTAARPETAGEFSTLHDLEKEHILAALKRCNDNRTHAARLLGISIRTLRNKLNEYSGKHQTEAGRTASSDQLTSSPNRAIVS
jgi:DNA-binding NtrC family response regulator